MSPCLLLSEVLFSSSYVCLLSIHKSGLGDVIESSWKILIDYLLLSTWSTRSLDPKVLYHLHVEMEGDDAQMPNLWQLALATSIHHAIRAALEASKDHNVFIRLRYIPAVPQWHISDTVQADIFRHKIWLAQLHGLCWSRNLVPAPNFSLVVVAWIPTSWQRNSTRSPKSVWLRQKTREGYSRL